MDVHDRIARSVRRHREARALSLEALAQRSGVSRSNISLIERGESSPTAVVLDKLASALGVTVASLFEGDDGRDGVRAAALPVARVAEQPLWTDPASGYTRRNVSPAGVASPLQLVDVIFPAGQRVAYETGPRDSDIAQQVWMIDGVMELTVGDAHWRLAAGDCLAMRLDRPIAYRNPGREPARYLVALVNLSTVPTGRPR